MKVLFVSGELTGSGLCQKLISEGNEVKLYIHKQDWGECYTGFCEKVVDWKTELDWVGKDGIIVFDDVIFGKEQDWLRELGYTVVGSSNGGDELERNRGLFQSIAESKGMNVLQSYDFKDAGAAIDFVTQRPQRWVLKQSSHLSYLNFIGVTSDGSDVLRVLGRYKDRNVSPVHLQEFASGVEIGVARYFNGTDWVGPIEINHEHKKLNDGDHGPLTPEMGTVIWYTDNEELPLYKKTLARFKPYLQRINFRGDFDINFIVNQDHIWPLEATPRFGAPSTQLQVELHKSPWADFLCAVGRGEAYALDYKKGYGVVVSVVVAPYPYEPSENSYETSLPKRIHLHDTLSKEELESIHFEEVSRDKEGHYWSGNFGIVLHVTAHDESIAGAQDKAYAIINKIHIDGMYYRKDIGTRVHTQDIPQLERWGWI
jgi:phosphoribosylamine--glycine ligase